jgi:hypothetical protein
MVEMGNRSRLRVTTKVLTRALVLGVIAFVIHSSLSYELAVRGITPNWARAMNRVVSHPGSSDHDLALAMAAGVAGDWTDFGVLPGVATALTGLLLSWWRSLGRWSLALGATIFSIAILLEPHGGDLGLRALAFGLPLAYLSLFGSVAMVRGIAGGTGNSPRG